MKRVWRTKSDKRLRIKDMTTKHINNCIKMLHCYHAHKLAEAYAFGNMIQGEQALIHFDQSLQNIEEYGWEDEAEEFIIAFEAELERRKND